jgi:hypothetical protein
LPPKKSSSEKPASARPCTTYHIPTTRQTSSGSANVERATPV